MTVEQTPKEDAYAQTLAQVYKAERLAEHGNRAQRRKANAIILKVYEIINKLLSPTKAILQEIEIEGTTFDVGPVPRASCFKGKYLEFSIVARTPDKKTWAQPLKLSTDLLCDPEALLKYLPEVCQKTVAFMKKGDEHGTLEQ